MSTVVTHSLVNMFRYENAMLLHRMMIGQNIRSVSKPLTTNEKPPENTYQHSFQQRV